LVASSPELIVRFGLFELDRKAVRLSKSGRSIRLPQQPLQLLLALVERPGEILTREDLQQRLWSSDVVVDFDHGLNKSIQKLRDALGDSATSPRYIETIPRIGYRFIAPVIIGAPAPESGVSPPHNISDPPLGVTQRKRWPFLAACITLLALAAGLLIYRRLHPAEPIRSLAVLPLENLSGDPGQEYFADGMTDELTTMLSKSSTLRIVSRTSVMQYKGARRPLREIAQALDVDGILEGSVARSGDQVHMTVQLIDARGDTHLWAESYDRGIRDLSSLPGEVARTISTRLHQAVPAEAPPRYIDPEAQDAYMRGRYLWFALRYDQAAEYFHKATEIQPDYALGWAGLSACYSASTMDGRHDPRISLPSADETAAKALQLDPSLPQANLAVGAALFFYRWNWNGADQAVRRAIELDPRYAEAYHLRARILTALNRNAEAIQAQKKEMELDPFARPWGLAYTFFVARQYDAAIDEARLRLEASPRDGILLGSIAESYRCKRMDKEAAQGMAKQFIAVDDRQSAAAVQRAYSQGGYPAVVRWQLSVFEKLSQTQYLSPEFLANLHAQLGQRDQALALLEEGYRQRSPQILWIQTDPAYDFLHSDERYRALIKKVGLPPSY
jgi:TolB-like protein/DNA-binding winged helix-turn-helix (wHTH) protein